LHPSAGLTAPAGHHPAALVLPVVLVGAVDVGEHAATCTAPPSSGATAIDQGKGSFVLLVAVAVQARDVTVQGRAGEAAVRGAGRGLLGVEQASGPVDDLAQPLRLGVGLEGNVLELGRHIVLSRAKVRIRAVCLQKSCEFRGDGNGESVYL
jgi:hypothetical protein